MILNTLDDWCALIDACVKRGAITLNIDVNNDGRLTGLVTTLRPLNPTAVAMERQRVAHEADDEKPQLKSLPAGLGYSEI